MPIIIISNIFASLFKQPLKFELIMKLQNDEVFNVLVGKISGAINRTFLRAFSAQGIDITTEQWSVLACLWEKDKVTQQTLCNLTAKDKPSMTRLIDKLEKQNLVTRVSDHNDRRINLIHLTSSGATLQEKANEIVQNIVNRTLNGITEDEINFVRIALKKIMVNLK